MFEMTGFAKFMKDIVTKTRVLDFETVEVSHSYSAIMSIHGVVKNTQMSSLFHVQLESLNLAKHCVTLEQASIY